MLLHFICDTQYASLSSAIIDGAKRTHITPLINDEGLGSSQYKNCRSISNPSFSIESFLVHQEKLKIQEKHKILLTFQYHRGGINQS